VTPAVLVAFVEVAVDVGRVGVLIFQQHFAASAPLLPFNRLDRKNPRYAGVSCHDSVPGNCAAGDLISSKHRSDHRMMRGSTRSIPSVCLNTLQ
jgi:hypothetical protein